MDPIRQSYLIIAAKSPDVIADFYARLFRRRPETRALFGPHMGNQIGKFAGLLELCVLERKDGEDLAPVLRTLGQRHRDRAIDDDLYPDFIDCFIEAVAAEVGDIWTQEHDRAWRDTMAHIAEMMRRVVS